MGRNAEGAARFPDQGGERRGWTGRETRVATGSGNPGAGEAAGRVGSHGIALQRDVPILLLKSAKLGADPGDPGLPRLPFQP